MNFNIDEIHRRIIGDINHHVLGKKTDSYDVLVFANLQAALESAKYFNLKMHKSRNYESDLDLLSHAMEIRPQDGLILEFGVASGRTINHISSLTNDIVYGFDVFTGLPEDWRTGFGEGSFRRADLPKVNENVRLIAGLFEDTLDDFLKDKRIKASLIHIDCDLYSGTKTILTKLDSLITSGTVIVFDEYFNYPGWEHHEFKAFSEYVAFKGVNYRYDSLVSKHQQVCVVIG